MAWQVYKVRKRNAQLKAGEVRVNRSGWLVVALADLQAAGVAERAVIELDIELSRLAVRAPLENEGWWYTVRRNRNSTGLCEIRIRGPLAALGLRGEQVAGDYPCHGYAKRIVVKLPRAIDLHHAASGDGPTKSDPTPDEIEEKKKELRAARLARTQRV